MDGLSNKNNTSASPAGTEVFLAFGSNIGDRESFFHFAVNGLKTGGLSIEKISPLYETEPENCEDGVPPFLNAVLSGIWPDTPEALLNLCQSLERQAGRPAIHSSRQSRQLDLDLILFGQQIICSKRLIVPHPRASQRKFVLLPMNDIAPDAIFPDTGKTVRELLNQLSN